MENSAKAKSSGDEIDFSVLICVSKTKGRGGSSLVENDVFIFYF